MLTSILSISENTLRHELSGVLSLAPVSDNIMTLKTMETLQIL